MKVKTDLDRPATKRDLEEMLAQIIVAMSTSLEDYPTKEEIKKELAPIKSGIEKLNTKFDNLNADGSENRRRIIDLETESATRTELTEHKKAGHSASLL